MGHWLQITQLQRAAHIPPRSVLQGICFSEQHGQEQAPIGRGHGSLEAPSCDGAGVRVQPAIFPALLQSLQPLGRDSGELESPSLASLWRLVWESDVYSPVAMESSQREALAGHWAAASSEGSHLHHNTVEEQDKGTTVEEDKYKP